MSQTHSKKLTVFAAVLILFLGIFIGGYLVLKSGKISAGQLDEILQGKTYNALTCNPDTTNANRDSDEDGLKDWEELQLYGTNPCKQDSDGDGYLDGEEVASGYDPAKKAPGDELPGTAPKTPRPLPENLTKALSSMLSQQMMAGKIDSFTASGQVLSTEELEKYPALQKSVEQILADAGKLFAPDPIDENQIKTTQKTDASAIQKYAGEAMRALYPSGAPSPNAPSEIDIFLETVRTGDLSKLSANLIDYQQAYERLLNLTVPKNLLDLHKRQIQIFSTFIKLYQGVQGLNNDPLRSYLAIQYYQAATQELVNWMNDLELFIVANYTK